VLLASLLLCYIDGNPVIEKLRTMGKEVESLDLSDMEVRGPKV
jgi:hypothetical protein